MMTRHKNLLALRRVARQLGNLLPEVAFVGGSVVALYLPEEREEDIRPTEDVDVVVEIATYAEFSVLEERLRAQGFTPDTTSSVMCRYTHLNLVLDVVPTLDTALGFTNRWYKTGMRDRVPYTLDDNLTIHIFPADVFLATKLEALLGRGGSDYRLSSDFEDIVQILAFGLPWKISSEEVGLYLTDRWADLAKRPNIEEEIEAQLPRGAESFLSIVMARLPMPT